jgi:hypothetical protein
MLLLQFGNNWSPDMLVVVGENTNNGVKLKDVNHQHSSFFLL